MRSGNQKSWQAWLDARREELVGQRLLRRLRALSVEDGLHVDIDGRPVVLFSSNDYLGLSDHPTVREAASEAVLRHGFGPRGSALVCGYTGEHEKLEMRLAKMMGSETALLFPTGYAANLSVLSTLADRETEVFSDEMNHASIIDGCRLAAERGARVSVYRHADVEHLGGLLEASTASRKLIVTDSVFSMDGDLAPLGALVELKDRHGALLAVDEAHALLVLGARGGGLAEVEGLIDRVDLRVGTLGKALGAQGGVVATNGRLREHLLNRGRPYIYSTALPLPVVAAVRAALDVFAAEPERRERLDTHRARLGEALGAGSPSAIFKLVTGSEESALIAAEVLLKRGIYVPAIRPPTVPPGSCRLRITLSAGHTRAEVGALSEALSALGPGFSG